MLLLTSRPFVTYFLHDIGCRAIEAIWRSDILSSDFRLMLREGLSLAQQHHAKGWVADDRLLAPLLLADEQWALKEVVPMMADRGIQRLAVVETKDALRQLQQRRMYRPPLPVMPLEFRYFTDIQEARIWACQEPSHEHPA